ncbi:MAG: hypothetical protein ACYSRR_06315 [Planctomycetota bacterium]|jgi:hypothetical protein
MMLSAKEKDCLQFLVNWDQTQGIIFECKVIMETLDVDHDVYESVIKKMEKIGAVKDVAQGFGQDYAEYFKISERILLQAIWQKVENE